MTTPRTGLAEIAEGQAKKYVTHNEALRRLDALVQTTVQSQDLDSPPAHADGNLWIVGFQAWDVVAVDTANDVVEVSGDQTGRLSTSDAFAIAGSTGNDGDYTIAALTYNSTSGNTEITVNEDLTDSTADGEVRHADGAWNGHVLELAQSYNGAWYFLDPWVGLRAWDLNTALLYRWDGDAWVVLGGKLDALTDVSAASPSDGQLLQYNAGTGRWEAVTFSGSNFAANKWSGPATWTPAGMGGNVAQVVAELPTAGVLTAEVFSNLPVASSVKSMNHPNGPQGVAIEPSTDYLWTNENGNGVEVYDWDANLITAFSGPGPSAREADMTVDGAGNLIIAYTTGQIYLMDGFSSTVVDSIDLGFTDDPCGVAWDPNTGDLLVMRGSNRNAWRMDGFSSTVLDSFTFPDDPNGYGYSMDPRGMAFDGASTWLSDNNNNVVIQFEGFSATSTGYDFSLTSGLGLSWDHTGALVSIDGSKTIYRHDSAKSTDSTDTLTAGGQFIDAQGSDGVDIVAANQAFAIVAVDTGADTLQVSGDQTAIFAASDTFAIAGSTGNDGTYTLTERSWSVVTANATNDYFELDTDLTAYFEAGETFEIQGSTGNDGTWTVSSVTFNSSGSNRTRIYTSEDVTDGTNDGNLVIPAVRYYSGSDQTQLQTSESLGDSTADGDVEMWKGTAYAAVNWAG
jgi:hypothetical protein